MERLCRRCNNPLSEGPGAIGREELELFPGIQTHQQGKCLPRVVKKLDLSNLCPACKGNGSLPQEGALSVHDWCPRCGGTGKVGKAQPPTPWKTVDGTVSHYWMTLPNGKWVSACGEMAKSDLMPEEGDRCPDCEARSSDG